MSTSDPASETVLTTDTGNTKVRESSPGAMASLPDAAVIARLANEFFAALPGHGVTAGATSVPTPPAPPPAGIVFPPIPASPAVGEQVAPQALDFVLPPSLPGSPAYFFAPEKAASPTAAPTYPSATELFSFPSVPGAQPLPSIPFLPWAQAPVPSSKAGLSAIPALLTEASPRRPESYAFASPPPVPGSSAYFLDGLNNAPLAAAPSFPPVAEIFSFPAVPGAQSVPGSSGYSLGGGKTGALASAEPQLESREVHPELVPQMGLARRLFDAHVFKRDFPILEEQVHGRPLVWLDNAATTQKPNAVIDRLSSFYQHENSNIHRAAHTLAARATDAYEGAREKVRRFLNAGSAREIIFVRGATEGINLVAKSWGHRNVEKDDEIVITWLEHHANIVPWQQLAAEKGARLRVAPVDDRGQIILEEYEKLLGPRTRIVSFSQVSNALGTITPAREMIQMAHRHGARVLVDGAQSVAHLGADVQALDCDFFVFSGHKIFAPTGIGVVFGKADLLETAPPWQGGGSMIMDVTFEKTIYNVPPARFEAGTGNIADAVGLGAALDYLDQIGMENIARYEHALLQYATAGLLKVPGLRLIGTALEKAGVISFVLEGMPTDDVGRALDQKGIAVRAGHHCAQPILRRFGVESTVRPSLALYNTTEDIDALVAALLEIQVGRGRGGP
jgi:cysteine desulfurase/selenocysteine lyase